MLFDLRSPRRRRTVQVVFGTLAVLFAVSFVFFGIGSEVQGGFGDLIGQGGGGDSGQEDAIEDAEKALEENPNDTAALAELVQLHYQAGTAQIEIDPETQQQTVTSDAEQELLAGADAWDRYLKLSKKQVSSSTALLAVQTFATLAQAKLTQAASSTGQQALDDADDSLANWKGAAAAQQVVAGEKGDADSYATLATMLFFAGEFDQAEQATQQAVAAAKGSQGDQLKTELEGAEKQGREITTAIEQFRAQLQQATAGAPGGATGENPLSGLGGGGLSGGGLTTP